MNVLNSLCTFVLPFIFLITKLTATTETRAVDDVIRNYFVDLPKSKFSIEPLVGGHSNVCLKISVDGQSYVLRIKSEETSEQSFLCEHYAMKQAAKLGIGPKVFYVSFENKSFLMEHIEGRTSKNEELKSVNNCSKVMNALRQFHTTPKNPYHGEDSIFAASEVYQSLSNFPGSKMYLDKAYELMWNYYNQLVEYKIPKVNLHGELNSRNIFLNDDNAILIDWEYTCWEDPFSDLAYFAIRSDYNESEELFMLKSYLQPAPTDSEIVRYTLVKKYNFAQLAIWFHFFAVKFNGRDNILNNSTTLKEWSYYMQQFSDQSDENINLGQYYFEMAKCCVKLAE